MIVFDLECVNGHEFEGWFDDAQAFEEQNSQDMISCPYCDNTEIKRVLSPVAVKSSPRQEVLREDAGIDYKRLAKEVMGYINDEFEDLGTGFTKEALKIHYGVSEKRNIKGSATKEEEKILEEEGVQYFKIPVPKVDDEKKN